MILPYEDLDEHGKIIEELYAPIKPLPMPKLPYEDIEAIRWLVYSKLNNNSPWWKSCVTTCTA